MFCKVRQMKYVPFVHMRKRQIPYLTYKEKFTLVRWHLLCTPTKSLITWCTSLFIWSVHLITIKKNNKYFWKFFVSIINLFAFITLSVWTDGLPSLAGIYQSSSTNASFWQKIEFLNVMFGKKQSQNILQWRWGSTGTVSFVASPCCGPSGGWGHNASAPSGG